MAHSEVKFFPKFPLIDTDDLDPYFPQKFNDVIVTKKEFAVEKLDRIEPFPDNPGDYLRHQKYIARYMSVYDELLLFHEPGTGKTCTAVAAIEMLRYAEDKTIQRAIICAKGEGLTKNFLQEFMFTCTDGRYVPEDYENLTEIQQTTRMRKIASEFYTFKTFETFAKDLATMKDGQIQELFEDTIFIVDEVHNLREHDVVEQEEGEEILVRKRAVNIYDEFHRLFHLLNRRKIILMSGTPIKDTPDEFASLMNLILPLDRQINVKSFVKDFFNREQTILLHQRELADLIKGRVSYLNAATTTVVKRFVGRPIGSLNHFIVSESIMSEFQSDAYSRAYEEDKKERSIFINSRQASLFVFPDGSYGSKGFNKYIANKRELNQLISSIKDINKLHKFSAKYAQFVDVVLSQPKSKHFVYCQYVNGSGAVVLGKMLEAFGFRQATGTEKSKGLRYALCTRYESTSKQIQQLVNRFNSDDNIDGEYISVIIGSRVLNEGFTLKNVRNEFIMTGHWNYAEVAQSIARGWRLGSHNALLARGDRDVHVDVYQCVSLPNNDTPSIDLELYETAEKKDVVNRLIERLVKETAFDCALTIDRNKILGYDGQRECDYQSCDYTCNGRIGDPLDASTYGLWKDIQTVIKTEIKTHISEIVSQRDFFLSIESLSDDFSEKYTKEEIIAALSQIIDESTLFYDAFGFPHFLSIQADNSLFLTIDPSSRGILNDFYNNNRVLEAIELPFSRVVSKMYDRMLPDLVEQIFTHNTLSRKLIVELPYKVQRLILQGCLLAEKLGKTQNVAVRDDIIDFYNGFYGMKKGKLTIWLYADEIGAICLDENINEFVPCEMVSGERLVSLKTSKIGWYGLLNPTTNDFCIRDVEERDVTRKETEGVDLRRVTVGKRCVNYEKNKLVEIAAEKMKIAPRSTVLSMSKKDLCSEMKDWFESHKLLETNFDCGTSKKSRGKFIS